MANSSQSDAASNDATTLCDPAHRPQIAALKRVFELWVLDKSFHDAFLADPASALADTGLDVDLRAASFLLLGIPEDVDVQTELPESLAWFRDLMEGRAQRNMYIRTHMLPSDPRFRDWNLRQQRRCDREHGYRGKFMMHQPLVFELSSGCSVGCAFCGLSAGKLKGVFRHTKENAALWQEVLARAHSILGDAAQRTCCYHATEPLDNPDYELFLQDFYDEFGRIPQTTTAAPTRNTERTRKLLHWGQKTYEHFDRLSVLSEAVRDELFAAFTPEELIFTDLLPQFKEAPGVNFIKAGRNNDASEGSGSTIACVSGFVVNMWERSIRLTTPTYSSGENPTGELNLETASFVDGASFEAAIQGMIERHMHETIDLADFFGTTL